MVSTPFSLTEAWTPANSSMAGQDCEMLLSNISASDIRWARSADSATPAIAPAQAHILRPGRTQKVPMAGGETIWMAGSPRGTAAVDVFERLDAPLVSRAELVARVVSGRTRPDGEIVWAGEHAYVWQAGATVIADMPGIVPLAPYNGEQFGLPTTNNNGAAITGDFSAILQAAHDYIAGPVIGGGTLYLGSCKFGLGSTVYFGELGPFMLVGAGRGYPGNDKWKARETAATRIGWTGPAGGTMIEFTSDRHDTGLNNRGGGGGMRDIHLDGNETADYCLRVRSHSDNDIKIRTSYARVAHILVDTLDNGVSGSTANVQRCRWNFHCDDVAATIEPLAQVVINGSDSSMTNTSITIIEEMRLVAERQAVAVHFGSVDATLVQYMHAATRVEPAVGDGGKVFFHATDTLPDNLGTDVFNRTRDISIGFVEAPRGIVAKAAVGAGENHAAYIRIDTLSRGNGTPLPVQEAFEGQISFISTRSVAQLGAVEATIVDRLCPVSGTADAIALTTGANLTSVTTGTRVRFMATATNTGPTTIQADFAGAVVAKTVTGDDLPAGYIRTDVQTEAVFDGTNWIVDRADEYVGTAASHFVRYANGQQVCREQLLLTHSDSDTLTATCTYPAPFLNSVSVFPSGSVNTSNLQSNVSGVSKEELTPVQFGNITNTACNVFLNRTPGGANFVTGDETTVRLQFDGVWY